MRIIVVVLIWALIQLSHCSSTAKGGTAGHKNYFLVVVTFILVFSFPDATELYSLTKYLYNAKHHEVHRAAALRTLLGCNNLVWL